MFCLYLESGKVDVGATPVRGADASKCHLT